MALGVRKRLDRIEDPGPGLLWFLSWSLCSTLFWSAGEKQSKFHSED